MAEVDLLVTNYNTKDKLIRLLDTLHFDYKPGVWRLYISDNGSTDGSVEWLQSTAADEYDIDTVFYNENIGYAAASNMMANHSHSDGLAILNADVWMKTQDVDLLTLFMLNVSNVGVVGPKQRDENGHITHAGIMGSNVKPQMRSWMVPDPLDRLHRQRDKCVTVSGSAYFVPRYVWNEMVECPIYQRYNEETFGHTIEGAFLNTPHYYEETAMSYHVRAHGYDVWYDGTVSVGHTWHASSPRGGFADAKFKESQALFRGFCDLHGISRD